MYKLVLLIAVVGILLSIICFNVIYMAKHFSTISNTVIIVRIAIILGCIIFVLMIIPYIKPDRIDVCFEEIACIELETGTLNNYCEDWWSIYCIDYGLFKISDDCYYKYPNLPPYKGEFPQIDTSKYTYIYTFKAPLEELYYNVWDCEGVPILDFGLSTKWGQAVLGKNQDNNKVYVYRIPQMAIANEENACNP